MQLKICLQKVIFEGFFNQWNQIWWKTNKADKSIESEIISFYKNEEKKDWSKQMLCICINLKTKEKPHHFDRKKYRKTNRKSNKRLELLLIKQ